MKRIFQVLMVLFFLLAGCSPVEENIELRSDSTLYCA
jgi:hypothetical protein